MFGNVVKLVFQSASIGSGLDDFIAKTKAGLTNSNMLGQGVAKLSTIFGGLGASIGGAVNMLLHGGVWGAAAEGVKMVIGAVQKWRAEAALAAEANAKAFAEVQEKAKAAAEQMKSAYQKSNEAIDAAAKKKKEDIELTNKQTKAELELAAAKAKAAGKDKEAAALEAKAGAVDAKGKEETAAVDVNTAQQKLDAAKKAASGLPGWKNTNGNQKAYENLDAAQKKLDATYQKKIEEYAAKVEKGANAEPGILSKAGQNLLRFFGFGREETGNTKVMYRGEEFGRQKVTKERVSEAIRAGGVTGRFKDFLKNDKEYAEAQRNVNAARKAIDSQNDSPLFNRTTGKDFEFDPKAWKTEMRRLNGRISNLRKQLSDAERENTSAIVSAVGPTGSQSGNHKITDVSALKKELEMETEARKKFIEQMRKAKQAAENIADAERVLTAARKEEKIAIVENQKSTVIAKTAAAKASKDEMLKKYQGEKSGYDTRRQSASSEVSRWQGEFNVAFDLWRDPDAAASAVEADKKRGEDMKRFRKEVNRYGGKGKIDEYARLMRAGDEEGMQERLTQWRKSAKFTPQVEQMVKAAAADQNKNAAEKSLANIEKNTADLAKKIDELLSLK